ncbi:hypothetical protein [Paenibacillus beijingensis]|uniref:Uncharacterized protein n=1 Tax=Paenibacillus beijingensis TaxID=1126833 RepID=A0A0D5NIA6_9BACL|nr:hypothetical protein [Paenibacillus beijingensis]AJY74638.1 hypothetical protein VN24_08695 [Paenibacillus beijingensis]
MINGYIWPSQGSVSVLGHRFGEVVQSGRTADVMTTRTLSGFFEAPVAVDRHGDRFYVRPVTAVNQPSASGR